MKDEYELAKRGTRHFGLYRVWKRVTTFPRVSPLGVLGGWSNGSWRELSDEARAVSRNHLGESLDPENHRETCRD